MEIFKLHFLIYKLTIRLIINLILSLLNKKNNNCQIHFLINIQNKNIYQIIKWFDQFLPKLVKK